MDEHVLLREQTLDRVLQDVVKVVMGGRRGAIPGVEPVLIEQRTGDKAVRDDRVVPGDVVQRPQKGARLPRSVGCWRAAMSG